MVASKKKVAASKPSKAATKVAAAEPMEDIAVAASAPAKRGQKRAASPVPVAAAVAVVETTSSRPKRVKKEPVAASSSSAATPTPESLATLHAHGEVFAVGSGDCSQLGLGPDEDLREAKKATLLKTFAEKKLSILAIAAGSLHNLVLDSKHAVWSWGCNDDFALGRESDEWLPEPVVGPLGKGTKNGLPVVQITCGASHSLALTADGDAYCFGTFRDANGVIGFSETIEAAKQPMKMSFSGKQPKIVMIASGEHHDLALTETGDVYQWGDIGIGRRFSDRNKKTKLTPSRVLFKKHGSTAAPKKIVKIFAGGHSSYGLDENGVAWFFGPNNYHQAGLPNEDENKLMVLTPTPILGLPPLAKVACASHHSLFLTTEGKVYSTGRGEDGRLGHGDMENYDEPTLIKDLAELDHDDKIVDINCGECHSFAISEQGRLYGFGYGDLLQLGNGIEEDVGEPLLIDGDELVSGGPKKFGRKVVYASGGAQHSIFLAVARTKKAPWADEAPKVVKEKKVVAKEPAKITSLSQLMPTSGWECDICMVHNKDELNNCAACETPRGTMHTSSGASGAAAASSSSATKFGAPVFNFGGAAASSTDAAAASSAPSFSFGGAAPVAAGAGGFSFGAAAATTDAAAATVAPSTGGFSFGATPAAGGFTFGAQQ